MLNMLNFELKAVDVSETIIINKRKLNNENMQVFITKSATPLETHENHYAETCTVDFYPISEENIDILNRTFSVRVSIVGVYQFVGENNNIDLDEFREASYQELFIHLRTALATAMTNAGMTPYYIPTTFCK